MVETLFAIAYDLKIERELNFVLEHTNGCLAVVAVVVAMATEGSGQFCNRRDDDDNEDDDNDECLQILSTFGISIEYTSIIWL
eukprot:CAMPEP_0185264780 /NCGR_PEP_ID=MMETSP1359-20130426/24762_1 /TAXON_ID=552665 /ORGANISM="Bigelowiella longifila, Strain CCMP242" /LENGTH=82 /DNA_ID=CAMNT_0027853583 /DNA_START=174 /DNA_END=419 /DNA_ORIENTATION=+